MHRRFLFQLLAVLLMAIAFPWAGAQQTFPSKAVTIVVPYPAGGPVDKLARALSEELAKKWSQPVLVDNKPGASEIIASQYVARSAPDGHVLFMASDAALAMNEFAFKKLPYDPVKDFAPVTWLADVQLLLLVSPDFPASNMREFLDVVKKSPGKYSFANPGTLQYLIGDFERNAGLDMPIVTYNGLAPLLPDLIAGRTDAALGQISSALPLLEAGKLKAIALSGKKRSPVLPTVPTLAEVGFGHADITLFSGIVARAGTPQTIIAKISADMRDIMSDPAFRARNLDPFGLELVASSPVEFADFLVRNRLVQSRRFKLSGATPN